MSRKESLSPAMVIEEFWERKSLAARLRFLENSCCQDFDQPKPNSLALAKALLEKGVMPVVIKPEAVLAAGTRKLPFVERKDVEVITAKLIVHTPKEWLEIYWPTIKEYPDSFEPILGPLLELNTNFPSWVVAAHLPLIEQGENLNESVEKFKREKIGRGGNRPAASLRSMLLPMIEQAGFLTAEGLVEMVDREGSLSTRLPELNARTFNGVHCPNSAKQAAENFAILFNEEELSGLLNLVLKQP